MQQAYKTIFRIIYENKYIFCCFFIINVIRSGLEILFPYFSKLQIDQLENRYTSFFNIFYVNPELIFALIVFIIIVSNVFKSVFSIISGLLYSKINYDCSVKIEKDFYERVEKFDVGFMQNPRNRRIANNSIDMLFMTRNLLDFSSEQIGIIISILGILPVIAYFSPSIFLVILITGAIQIIIIKARTKKDKILNIIEGKISSHLWELRNLIFYEFHNIANIDSSNYVINKYWELRKKEYLLEMKSYKIREKYSVAGLVSQNFSYMFIAIFVGHEVMTGNSTIGTFTMLMLYAGNVQNVFEDIARTVSNLSSMAIQFHKVDFFMNLKPRLKLNLIKNIKQPILGNIIFNNASFNYPSFLKEEKEYIKSIIKEEKKIKKKKGSGWEFDDISEWKNILKEKERKMPLVLKKINIEFKANEITALVGRNGSGKTTLANLIIRNYDPIKGNISIGGINLVNLDPHYIKKYVSIIPQRPFLLESFSVRENVYFDNKNKKIDNLIWDIFERLDLKKDIEKLPKKLDSIIGDDIQFSGGQSQLLSIARVLIQNRPIIIFDEGTSQLDAEHEAKIINILNDVKFGKTIIVITHRMTTARKSDTIYVIDDGRIVENGRHDVLVKRSDGLYKKFWDLQVVN